VYGHDADVGAAERALVQRVHGEYAASARTREAPEGGAVRRGGRDEDAEMMMRCAEAGFTPAEESAVGTVASHPAWMAAMVQAQQKEGEGATAEPRRAAVGGLALERVLSYNGAGAARNLHVLHTGELLFSSGAVCVVDPAALGAVPRIAAARGSAAPRPERARQRFFTGHSNVVTCIALQRNEARNIAASGQAGEVTRVCIWDTQSMQPIAHLDAAAPRPPPPLAPRPRVFPLPVNSGVQALAFSAHGERLAVLSGGLGGALCVFEDNHASGEGPWSLCEMTDATELPGQAVCVDFNPHSDALVTAGARHLLFWEVQRGCLVGRHGDFGCENPSEVFLAVVFVDRTTTVTASESGVLWVWQGLRIARTVARAHEGPVMALASDGHMVLSAGKDGRLAVWNLARDWRVLPPGAVERGEMLVRELPLERAGGVLGHAGAGCVRALAWRGHTVLVGTAQNQILALDDITGEASLLLGGHRGDGRLRGMVVHPHLPWVLSVGEDGLLLCRDMASGRPLGARHLVKDRPARKAAALAAEAAEEEKKRRASLREGAQAGQGAECAGAAVEGADEGPAPGGAVHGAAAERGEAERQTGESKAREAKAAKDAKVASSTRAPPPSTRAPRPPNDPCTPSLPVAPRARGGLRARGGRSRRTGITRSFSWRGARGSSG